MVRYVLEMGKALAARSDVDVHVHCRSTSMATLSDAVGIGPERLHASRGSGAVADGLRELVGLGSLLKAVQPNVVFGSKHLVPLLPTTMDIYRVLTVHDMLPFDRPGDFAVAKRLLLPPMYRSSLRRADLLACVSEATRQRLVDRFPEVEPQATVVSNAMTPSLARVDPQPLSGVDCGKFVLVVGDRSPRKNVRFVAELWADVVERRPNARLVLVGPPGWGTDEEVSGIADLVASGSVIEAGHVSEGQLRWAYENAAATLCPSRLEGFGLPVVEALGFGCPVIHSTDPAQIEAANGAGTAIGLDDRRSWIEASITHLDGTDRHGPNTVPRRTWDDAADELVGAVAEMSGRSTRSPR